MDKKVVLGFSVFLLFSVFSISLISASWFSNPFDKITGSTIENSINCTDSDNGLNYYNKGSTLDNNQVTTNDVCLADNPKRLSEVYCEDGVAKSALYDCPNGCGDSACACPTTKCSDGTIYGPEKCSVKENVCACPSCPPTITPVITCPTMPTCIGAKDTGQKDSNGCLIYSCPPTATNTTSTPTGTPICQSTRCSDGTTLGCNLINNQCVCSTCPTQAVTFYISGVQGVKKTYSPSEMLNLMIKGVEKDGTPATTEEGFNVQFYIDEWPLVQGQNSKGDNAYYKEGYWYGNIAIPDKLTGYRLQIFLYCSREDSSCTKNYGTRAQIENTHYFSVTKSACNDSDGLNYYTKGFTKASAGDSGQYDSCLSQKELVEYYCENNEAKKASYSCPNGCVEGACTQGERTSEEVFCNFMNSQKEQKCYTASSNDMATCSGIGNCSAEVKGYKGDQITWKSTCGGYQYTTTDGNDEKIEFNCTEGETNIAQVLNKGFKKIYFQCYDGTESKSTEREACKSADYWKKFASQFCENNCDNRSGKCGINSFSIGEECYTDEVILSEARVQGTPVEITAPAATSAQEGDPTIVCKDSCPSEGKCYPFGYRKSGKFCSDAGNFIEQSKEETVCENNFECSSNVCISGTCVSQGLLQNILNWFKNLFG